VNSGHGGFPENAITRYPIALIARSSLKDRSKIVFPKTELYVLYNSNVLGEVIAQS